jgi:hypothetical protein
MGSSRNLMLIFTRLDHAGASPGARLLGDHASFTDPFIDFPRLS